jgi:hypothetical protein
VNKKGQLVALIAIAIAAVVFLVIVWPKLAVMLKGAGSGSTCNLNLFLSAAVKAATLGFAEVPPGCEAEYVIISKEDVDSRKNIAKKRLDKYYTDNTGHYAGVRAAFGVQNGITDNALNEWALDSILGKEMVDCWNKVWHGKLDLVKRSNAVDQNVFCVVCNVISYSEDLPANLRDRQQIDSLYAWAKAEPYFKTTYYDFLADGMTFQSTQSDMTFSTKVPTAVVYIESKKGWLMNALPAIGYTIGYGATAALIVSGVGAPAGILGAVLLGTTAAVPSAVVGIGAATATDAAIQAFEKDVKTFGEAVKEKEVKGVGVTPYQALGGLCTVLIA